jgi:hypothetical protein
MTIQELRRRITIQEVRMTVSEIWAAYRALQRENEDLRREIERLRAIEAASKPAPAMGGTP